MKKLIYIAILTVAFCFTANAQKVEIDQATADKCARCFVESKAKDDLISALQAENASRKEKDAISQGIITAQGDLIKILEKQSKRKISFFFGLVKVTY